MAKGIHTEETFEGDLLGHNSYETASTEAYDRNMAILPKTVLALIQATQPKVWVKL